MGWEDLKDAFTKPRGDKEQKNWYKKNCANVDKGLDPWKRDLLQINKELDHVRPGPMFR